MFFDFNVTSPTDIYTLSLHDALPILLITFLKASHSFRNRLLVICKNAYLFATMIMTRRRFLKDRKSGSAGMPRPISYAVFCLKKKIGEIVGGSTRIWDYDELLAAYKR